MELGLQGKRAVVTGASKGIGLAITRALVAEGAFVVAGARSSSAGLDELVAAGSVESVAVDLSAPSGPAALVTAALAHGPVDVVVNNVGAATTRVAGFLEISDDEWLATLNLNLMAAVRTVRAALPSMLAAGTGSIVTVSSVNSFLPDPAVIDYSAFEGGTGELLRRPCPRRSVRGGSGSTPSAPVRSRPTSGSAPAASPRPSPRRPGGDAGAVAAAAAGQMLTGRFTRPDEIADLVVPGRAGGSAT